jgi:hypothetical protein
MIEQLEVTTDTKGEYRFEPEHGGPFVLTAVADAQCSIAEFPVLPGDYRVLNLEPARIVSGVARDHAGQPMARATVRLIEDLEARSRIAIYRYPQQVATTTCDDQGRYRLMVELGNHRRPMWSLKMALQVVRDDEPSATLSLLHEDRPPQDYDLKWEPLPPITGRFLRADGNQADALTIDTVRDPRSGRLFAVAQDGSFQGRSLGSRLHCWTPRHQPVAIDQARSADPQAGAGGLPVIAQPGLVLRTRLIGPGGPLANARVLLIAYQDLELDPFEQIATTNADGKLELDCLPRGLPVLGYVEFAGRWIQFLHQHLDQDLELPALRIDPTRTLAGRITNADGTPVESARVLLLIDAGAPQSSVPPRVAYTDRTGRYRFDVVYDGPHWLTVDGGRDGLHGAPVPRELPPRLDVQIPAGLAIEGQVVRGAEKAPVPFAHLFVYQLGNSDPRHMTGLNLSYCVLSTMADGDGKFTMRGLPAAGQWSVNAYCLADDHRLTGRVTAQPGQPVQVVIGQ